MFVAVLDSLCPHAVRGLDCVILFPRIRRTLTEPVDVYHEWLDACEEAVHVSFNWRKEEGLHCDFVCGLWEKMFSCTEPLIAEL